MTAGATGALSRCFLVVLAGLLLLAPGLPADAALVPAATATGCAVSDGPPSGAVGADRSAARVQAAQQHDQHRSGAAKAAPVRAQRRTPAGPGLQVALLSESTSPQACASTTFTRRGPPHSGD